MEWEADMKVPPLGIAWSIPEMGRGWVQEQVRLEWREVAPTIHAAPGSFNVKWPESSARVCSRLDGQHFFDSLPYTRTFGIGLPSWVVRITTRTSSVWRGRPDLKRQRQWH